MKTIKQSVCVRQHSDHVTISMCGSAHHHLISYTQRLISVKGIQPHDSFRWEFLTVFFPVCIKVYWFYQRCEQFFQTSSSNAPAGFHSACENRLFDFSVHVCILIMHTRNRKTQNANKTHFVNWKKAKRKIMNNLNWFEVKLLRFRIEPRKCLYF